MKDATRLLCDENVAEQLFHNVETLHQFHAKNILLELQIRMGNWLVVDFFKLSLFN